MQPLVTRNAPDQLRAALARHLAEVVAKLVVGTEAALLLHAERVVVPGIGAAPKILEPQRAEGPAHEGAHRLGNQPAAPVGSAEPVTHLGVVRADTEVAPLGEEQPDAPREAPRLEQLDGVGFGGREDQADDQPALGNAPVGQPPRCRAYPLVAGQAVELGGVLLAPGAQQQAPGAKARALGLPGGIERGIGRGIHRGRGTLSRRFIGGWRMEGSEVQPASAELSARGAVFKAAGVAWPAQAVGSGRRHGSARAGRPGLHGRCTQSVRVGGSGGRFETAGNARPAQNHRFRLLVPSVPERQRPTVQTAGPA